MTEPMTKAQMMKRLRLERKTKKGFICVRGYVKPEKRERLENYIVKTLGGEVGS